MFVQHAQRLPHVGDRGRRPAHSSIGMPRAGVCAYSVQPRSSAATDIVVVLARPRSPMAIAISARCSTARRIEVCSGAVSLARSRSLRQNWRSAPPLRWFGPYNSTRRSFAGLVDARGRSPARRGEHQRPRSGGAHHRQAPITDETPSRQRPHRAVERYLQRGRADDQHHQRADEPADRQPQQRPGRDDGADHQMDRDERQQQRPPPPSPARRQPRARHREHRREHRDPAGVVEELRQHRVESVGQVEVPSRRGDPVAADRQREHGDRPRRPRTPRAASTAGRRSARSGSRTAAPESRCRRPDTPGWTGSGVSTPTIPEIDFSSATHSLRVISELVMTTARNTVAQ